MHNSQFPGKISSLKNPQKLILYTVLIGIAILTTGTAISVYNPDILRPLIKAGIPLKLCANLPIIGNAIKQAHIPEVTVQELKQLIDSNSQDFLLVDVRETEEYAIAKIPRSVLIPLSEIEKGEGIAKIKSLLKGRRLITHCQVGMRSAKVLVMLQNEGITGYNLKGGIQAWSREIDKSVPEY